MAKAMTAKQIEIKIRSLKKQVGHLETRKRKAMAMAKKKAAKKKTAKKRKPARKKSAKRKKRR